MNRQNQKQPKIQPWMANKTEKQITSGVRNTPLFQKRRKNNGKYEF